jgi:formylglycine-generating enzyme required for sulfatase activity
MRIPEIRRIAAWPWIAAALAAAPCAAVEYVPVPGGAFMGVLPPPGQVGAEEVAAFRMRETPVTNKDYRDFVRAHPQWRRDRVPRVFADAGYLGHWSASLEWGDAADATRPVTHVSWFAARAYCRSEEARLPTWIEWELAAAADETRKDAREDPAWRRRILSWYERPGGAPPAPVGGAANVYGVRDLHGLIWEWVEDFNALFIAEDSRDQNDPDKLRFCGAGALAVRDASNYAMLMRLALLSSLAAADTSANVGFRCVRSGQETAP